MRAIEAKFPGLGAFEAIPSGAKQAHGPVAVCTLSAMHLRSAASVLLFLAPCVVAFAACSSSDRDFGNGQAGAANVAGGGQSGAGAPSAGSSGTVSVAGSTSAGAGGTSAAGASGAAGAGGSAAGAAGTAGATSIGGAGNTGALPSAGCTLPATQELGKYVKFSETVSGVATIWQARDYFVYLPKTYDPKRAYPVVFVGPGCGGQGDQGIPMQTAAKEDAIVVGLQYKAAATGRDCFNTESYPDPEEDYFKETLKQVDAKYCVDTTRRFVEGFSSGSWLTNLIGCADGGLIRAQGNASGCMQGAKPAMCTGPVAYMAAHDKGDGNNTYQCGTDNRDRIVKLNGCSNETMAYDPGPDIKMPANVTISCVQYKDCKPGFPVVFCTTTGLGHNDQVGTGLSTFGFWKFWSSLPAKPAP